MYAVLPTTSKYILQTPPAGGNLSLLTRAAGVTSKGSIFRLLSEPGDESELVVEARSEWTTGVETNDQLTILPCYMLQLCSWCYEIILWGLNRWVICAFHGDCISGIIPAPDVKTDIQSDYYPEDIQRYERLPIGLQRRSENYDEKLDLLVQWTGIASKHRWFFSYA